MCLLNLFKKEKKIVLYDGSYKLIPDTGLVQYSFNLPDFKGYYISKVRVKINLWHEWTPDLICYLIYDNRKIILRAYPEDDSAFWELETEALADKRGGKTLVLVIEDTADGDEGEVNSVEISVFYSIIKKEVTYLQTYDEGKIRKEKREKRLVKKSN